MSKFKSKDVKVFLMMQAMEFSEAYGVAVSSITYEIVDEENGYCVLALERNSEKGE